MEQLLFTFFEANYMQFPFQLMVSEAVLLIGRERRSQFGMRIGFGVLLQFVLSFFWIQFINNFFDGNLFLYVLVYLGYAVISVLPIKFCFRIDLLEILFIVAGGYAIEHMTFSLSRIVLSHTSFQYALSGSLLHLLATRYLIYIVGAVVIYWLVIRSNNSKSGFSKGDVRIAGLAIVLVVAAVGFSVYWSYPLEYYGTLLGDVICPAYSFLCCTLVLLMEYYVLRENNMKREKELMEQLLQMSNTQQKSAMEAIDIINIKCHDLKHQIRALAGMEDAKVRQEYMNEVRQAVSIYDATYHTGCKALDYVLREKSLIFDEYQVEFSCMAQGDLINFMESTDVYALMGNALDNALERVLQESEEERFISLQIRKEGQMTLLHLENRCSREPEFTDGLPVTDKKDKANHGFGVKSIRYIVEKYHGHLHMRSSEGKFYLDILF